MKQQGSVCAILGAGRSERMGAQKLLLRFGETTLLGRALEAARDYRTVAVVTAALAPHMPSRPGLTVIVNDEPERGMTHSLRLANAALGDPDKALVVLLADTPLVEAPLVRRVVAARGEADLAYPVLHGVSGHPVVFGPRPRTALEHLAEGDTLRSLRDDRRWSRVEVATGDEAPYVDVDTPADLARARRMFARALEPAEVSRSHSPGE
jgi:molybdenum cofactor cytidylyltransferase